MAAFVDETKLGEAFPPPPKHQRSLSAHPVVSDASYSQVLQLRVAQLEAQVAALKSQVLLRFIYTCIFF